MKRQSKIRWAQFSAFVLSVLTLFSVPGCHEATQSVVDTEQASSARSIGFTTCNQCGCSPCKCAIELLEVATNSAGNPVLRINVAGCLKEVELPAGGTGGGAQPGINATPFASTPAPTGNDLAEFPFGFGTDPDGYCWYVDSGGNAKRIEALTKFTPSAAASTAYDVSSDPGPANSPANPIEGDEHWETYTNGKLLAIYDGDSSTWSHCFFVDVVQRIEAVDNYAQLRAFTGEEKVVVVRDPADSGIRGLFFQEETNPGNYAENGGTVLVASDGRVWRRNFDGVNFQVDWWADTVGPITVDGTTVQTGYDWQGNYPDPATPHLSAGIRYDSDKIQSAVETGGPGASIVFRKGKTYTIEKGLSTKLGQTFVGNSATLFRPDELTLETQAAVTPAGQNKMTLVDVTGLSVGDEVSAVFGNQATGSSGKLKINAINGNELTFNTVVQNEVPASTPVVKTHTLLSNVFLPSSDTSGLYDGTTIENLVFDGNRDNNQTVKAWNNATSFGSANNRVIMKNCGFINSPSESGGFDKGSIIDCWARDCNGSGIHLTGNSTVKPAEAQITVIGYTCRNMCEAGDAVTGHSEAAITFSNDVTNLRLIDCTIDTCAEFCIGLSSLDESELYIENLNAKNAAGIFRHSNSTTATLVRDFTIIDSNFENCGDLIINGSTSYREKFGVNNIKISGNTIVNGRMLVTNCSNVNVHDNTFRVDEQNNYPNWTTNVNQSAFAAFIGFSDVDKLTFKDNRVWGAQQNNNSAVTGVMIRPSSRMKLSDGTDSDFYYSSEVLVSGNSVANFRYGIAIGTSNAPHVTQVGLICSGWKYENNQVWLNQGTASGTVMVGIQCPPGAVCTDNSVYPPVKDTHGVSTNWYGIQALGIDDQRSEAKAIGAVVSNNFLPFNGCRAILVGTNQPDRNQFHAVITNNKYLGAIFSPFPANHHIADNLDLSTALPTLTDYNAPPRFDWGVNAGVY